MSNDSKLPASTASGWSEAQQGARAFSRRNNPMQMMGGTLLAADVAVVLTMSVVAHLFRYGNLDYTLELALITVIAALLLVNILKAADCYGELLTARSTVQITRALQGWCLVFIVLLIFAYITRTSQQFARVWVATWFVGSIVGLVAARIWAANRFVEWRKSGKLARTVAVVDLNGRGAALARSLVASSAGQMHLFGVFVPQQDNLRQNRIEDLLNLALLFRVDEVLISADGHENVAIDAIIQSLGAIPTTVRLGFPMPTLSSPPHGVSMLFGHPTLTLCSRPLGDWSKVAKRLEDLVISVVAIVILAPLMVIVSLLVKLDSPGPALFRQRRLGFNNNVIVVYKFRTMTHRSSASDDVSQAKRVDPRITRVGKFLRRTSIDELPQLFNVLQGDMSLVGPRPHALAHNEHYATLIDGYLRRHRMQPGITGWAQVNGFRGETDTLEKMQRRVEHDLAYTDGWSLALDIKILIKTVTTSLFDGNAY